MAYGITSNLSTANDILGLKDARYVNCFNAAKVANWLDDCLRHHFCMGLATKSEIRVFSISEKNSILINIVCVVEIVASSRCKIQSFFLTVSARAHPNECLLLFFGKVLSKVLRLDDS
jgi:hypothetical protein